MKMNIFTYHHRGKYPMSHINKKIVNTPSKNKIDVLSVKTNNLWYKTVNVSNVAKTKKKYNLLKIMKISVNAHV